MPQRTCSPSAIPIVVIGRTLRIELSAVRATPSGRACTKRARLYRFGAPMPPPMATQSSTNGPLQTPRRIRCSTDSKLF